MGLASDKYIYLILVGFSQISSPNNLERKLDLPGSSRRRSDRASSRNGVSVPIKNNIIIRGRAEIRVIENIEKLRPKLHVEGLRNPLDRIVLEQGHVKGHQAVA